MSRYIEKEYIGSAVAHLPTKILQTEHGIELVVPVTDVIEIIDSAPSIDIVRCRECRWQSVITDEEEGTSYYMCGVWTMPTDEDAFCSHGKRKE